MLIQSSNYPTHIDAAAKTVLNPQRLSKTLQRALGVRSSVIALAAQHGEIEWDENHICFHVFLKSGLFVMYQAPRREVEDPFDFDLYGPGAPQFACVCADDEPVFTMQWNRHGVFKMDNFEKGPWKKQIHKALARPDLHLI